MLESCRAMFRGFCEIFAWLILAAFAIAGAALGNSSGGDLWAVLGFFAGGIVGLIWNVFTLGLIAEFLCMGKDLKDIKLHLCGNGSVEQKPKEE